MADQFDIVKLSAMIRKQRGERGLREVAHDIGDISASTLSRIEQGNVPDLDTFLRICHWLGVSPDEFAGPPADEIGVAPHEPPVLNNADMITAHLRADRTLDPKTVEALSTMIRLAYEDAERRALQQQKKDKQ